MRKLQKILLAVALLALSFRATAEAQNLADLARQEQQKRASQNKSARVYTNDDLGLTGHSEESSTGTSTTDSGAPTPARPSSSAAAATGNDERAWSQRFIDARAKIEKLKALGQSLEAKRNSFSMNLLRQADVFDREHLYPELISQTNDKIEQNKKDLQDAEQELEDLRDALRKSGNPRGWEDSKAALTPEETEHKAAPQTKDQKYWQKQLAAMDKKYDELVTALETQKFEMINRRVPNKGESVAAPETLGLGVPPLVVELDNQIKEINTKREQEKKDLIDQALREGAFPGWFR